MADKRILKITKRAKSAIRADGKSALGTRGLKLDVDDAGGSLASTTARVGTPATITLMQAVDRLAGGPDRTAADVLALVSGENRDLEGLIEKCRDEASADLSLHDLPPMVPTLPLGLLISRLADVPPPRPKTISLLLRAAKQLEAKRAERETEWQRQHDFIINEAGAERLTLYARSRRSSTAPLMPIPKEFLLGGASIDTALRHLGYSSGAGGDTAFRRAIIAPIGERSIAYFGVVIMTGEFDRLMTGRLPDKHGRMTAAKRAEIEVWYRDDYIARHAAAARPPGRDADLAALRGEFGDKLVSVKFARHLRRHAPEAWRRPGPRKSGKK